MSTKITIACIAADLIPNQLGGAELHAVEVIKRLTKRHKIILFVGSDTTLSSQLPPPAVTVVPINYPKITNFYGLSFIFFGYFQAKKYLQHHPVDLIWAKQSFPQAPLAALLKVSLNKPLYITAQNPLLHHEELVIQGSPLAPFKKLLASCLTPLISWSFRQADLVAAVSRYSQTLSKKIGASKTIVIPNGINLSPSKRKPLKLKTFTIFSASSLIPRNGIDILIQAVSLLPSAINWQLVIAGGGPEMFHLKSQVEALKLSNKIKLLDRVPNSQVATLLSKANVFIRPSRWEGFGVAFVEAMSLQVPVIATPVGGITDFVKHRHTGLLANVEDPKSVTDNLILLYQDKKLQTKLVTNAFSLVKAKYTWDNIAIKVEKEMLKLCR